MAARRVTRALPGERGWTPPRFGRGIRIVLAYPGSYRVGMASLGFQTILHGFGSMEDVQAGRVFLDDGASSLRLLDGVVDPMQTDLFAFSVSSENDYPEILKILSLSGFPLRSRDRGAGLPPVLVGGIAPSLNPEPLAEFADLFVIGEGEETLAPIVGALAGREGGKGAVLEKMASIDGVYVPALFRPSYGEDGRLKAFRPAAGGGAGVVRARVKDFGTPPAVSRIIAPGSEFENLFLIEVNRGCGRGCRFCAAGNLMRPLRHRTLDAVLAAAQEGAATLERFGLLGSAVADHPDILAIMESLVERGWTFSVSSLRIDRATPELLGLLRRGGCRTVTLAPETGSERLRRAAGKRITDGQVLAAVEAAVSAGIPNIKLYFMIGLPTEEEEDREAIAELLKRIRHRVVSASRSRRRIGTVSASVSCFVPKAWTPFQWHPFADVKTLKGALSRLRRLAGKIPNVHLTHDLPKWAYVQALLSRADRRAAGILEAVHACGGDWGRALRDTPANPDFFVYRQRERDELFPWDFIDTGLGKERLWREYRRALEGTGEESGE